jgi:CheY-like chemotaxis protein
LASVYGIIANHGGSISVESEPGKGATFTLLLPVTDSPVAVVETPAVRLQRGRGTILVVDDEEAMTMTYSMLLRRLGYEVLIAAGGRQAVELVRQHGQKISLVLLDMIMPEMSGGATFDALRALVPDIKVLLASGYSLEGQARDIMARGCNGFIQKPFEAAELSAKLREILS